MDPLTTLSATPKGWLLNSVLAPHADAFVAHLKHGRYSPATRRTYLGSLAHLARWMTQCCLPLRLLDESAVERFLVRHVPRCDCPRPVNRTRSDLRATCAHLLDVLREQQVIAERSREGGHIADELRRYDDYMQRVQGLIEGTRGGRLRIVQRLLLHKFADGPVRVAAKINPKLTKRQISPHTIRHTTAMHLLQSGADISVIALWLGHESPTTTHHYVEADLAMKDRALARLQEPRAKSHRYRAPDSLLEFLKGL